MSVYDDLTNNARFSSLSKIIEHTNKHILKIAGKKQIDYLDREKMREIISLSIMLALSEHLKEIPDTWKTHAEWFKKKI